MKAIMKVMKIEMNRMVIIASTECISCISLIRHTGGTKKHTARNQISEDLRVETRVIRQRIVPSPFGPNI